MKKFLQLLWETSVFKSIINFLNDDSGQIISKAGWELLSRPEEDWVIVSRESGCIVVDLSQDTYRKKLLIEKDY